MELTKSKTVVEQRFYLINKRNRLYLHYDGVNYTGSKNLAWCGFERQRLNLAQKNPSVLNLIASPAQSQMNKPNFPGTLR